MNHNMHSTKLLPIQASKHETRLDALLCVAIGHCTTAFSMKPLYDKTVYNMEYNNISDIILRLFHIIFNADSAVIVFCA